MHGHVGDPHPQRRQSSGAQTTFHVADLLACGAYTQEVVHADALQVATLLFDKGADGKPKLDEVDLRVTISSLSGRQVAIAGHSLGGAHVRSHVIDLSHRFS